MIFNFLSSLFLSLLLCFSAKTQNFCSDTLNSNKKNIFLYQEKKSSRSLYLAERIQIRNDTLFLKTITFKSGDTVEKLIKSFDEESFKRLEKLDSVFIEYDTLIYSSKNKIINLSGKIFIDTAAPKTPEFGKLPRKREYVTITNVNYNGCRLRFNFSYTNLFKSHSSYNYTFQTDFWIIKYEYLKLKYKLISYKTF